MAISHINDLKQLITELSISDSPAEFHGFLCGLISGGIKDQSWQTLTFQFMNDGQAFSQIPLEKLAAFYQQLGESFEQANTLFSLWLPEEEDGFLLADSIAEWTGHFLLGLGLAQPQLQKESDEVNEAVDDLAEIAKLGYEESDSASELLEAGEEIIEYLRIVTLFLHTYFLSQAQNQTEKVH